MEPLIAEKTLREEIVGCSATTWWSWRKKNRLPPALRIGRRYYYRPQDVDQWLEDRKAETALLSANNP